MFLGFIDLGLSERTSTPLSQWREVSAVSVFQVLVFNMLLFSVIEAWRPFAFPMRPSPLSSGCELPLRPALRGFCVGRW